MHARGVSCSDCHDPHSLAIEGENQPGVFWVDNFIIRPFVDPEPTATLGPEEALPTGA